MAISRIDFDGQEFDIDPLLGRGELSPQDALKVTKKACKELFEAKKINESTLARVNKAQTPPEALLYLFNFFAWGASRQEDLIWQRETERGELWASLGVEYSPVITDPGLQAEDDRL